MARFQIVANRAFRSPDKEIMAVRRELHADVWRTAELRELALLDIHETKNEHVPVHSLGKKNSAAAYIHQV